MEQTSGRDNLGKLAPSLFPQLKAHYSTKNGGQILICVEGEGWLQEEGCPILPYFICSLASGIR